MADESDRKVGKKRIKLSSNEGDWVDVPVIMEISFFDPFDRDQHTRYTVDNSSDGSREVHVDQIHDVDGGGSLSVERVDIWPVFDTFERGQETRIEFDNRTGADTSPPSFVTHLKTHVVRYKNENSGAWIESELIDQFIVLDPFHRGQETYYTLSNTDEQAKGDAQDITSSGTVDPPWRTDPFQNLIRFSHKDQETDDSPRPQFRTSRGICGGLDATWGQTTNRDYSSTPIIIAANYPNPPPGYNASFYGVGGVPGPVVPVYFGDQVWVGPDSGYVEYATMGLVLTAGAHSASASVYGMGLSPDQVFLYINWLNLGSPAHPFIENYGPMHTEIGTQLLHTFPSQEFPPTFDHILPSGTHVEMHYDGNAFVVGDCVQQNYIGTLP